MLMTGLSRMTSRTPTAPVGSAASLELAGDVGSPPIRLIFTPAGTAAEFTPETVNGAINISEGVSFTRGDANGDANVNISDALEALDHLFQSEPAGRCQKALDAIRHCLEADGPIIVEHWFYRGSCAPERVVFGEFEAFAAYLAAHAAAGDAIHVWSFAAVCRDDNTLASGKCPDETGLVPERGAY